MRPEGRLAALLLLVEVLLCEGLLGMVRAGGVAVCAHVVAGVAVGPAVDRGGRHPATKRTGRLTRKIGETVERAPG